jgi:hypothetical protein
MIGKPDPNLVFNSMTASKVQMHGTLATSATTSAIFGKLPSATSMAPHITIGIDEKHHRVMKVCRLHKGQNT